MNADINLKRNLILNYRMKIAQEGYWCGEDVLDEHCHDTGLEKWLVHFLSSEDATSVIDLGCGLAEYSKTIQSYDIPVKAFDGNPSTPILTDGFAQVLDLTKSFQIELADWVLCLEVGEHIPKAFEMNLIDNIHRHAKKGVILSWAIPGQGGTGHVNCQPNEYIKSIFTRLDYINDIDAELHARKFANLSWFKDTIMIFRKKNEY